MYENSIRVIKGILPVVLFLCSSVSSAFVNPGDNDYLIFEEEKYRIIFDRQYLNSIETINQKIKAQLTSMSEFKKRGLQESLTVILFSSKNQISNAFATVLPSFTIGMFPSGMIGLGKLSVPFWFDGVFEHELNHIFQLSYPRYPLLNKFLKLPSFLFFYIYTPYPNMFLPMFVIEGDSVLKESLRNYGGRLYNGRVRALVFSQINYFRYNKNRFIKQNLLNLRLTPHSGQEKYQHGAYIMAMLANTYSHETVNDFFKIDKRTPSRKVRKQIKNTPVRERLSPLFAEAFSFQDWHLFLEDLIEVYFDYWLKEAHLQKTSPEPVLFKSHVCPEFSEAENEIFFLTSDYKSPPELRIFNKITGKWKKKVMDLPLDKVFKIDGIYYARSTESVKPYTVHYSLFSEGLYSNDQFDSQYVQDIQNQKVLSIDSRNNLNGFNLYLNKTLYSDVHSNSLFDEKGNIYFFKQKGRKRTLYRNKKPLFSYQGYYGHLLDIEKDGAIYFTGSSPYGSSIYQYKSGKISRSVSSDAVIQAKKISDKEFIVCEITPYDFEYKIIPLKVSQERPILYQYSFKKRQPISVKSELDSINLVSKEQISESKMSAERKLTKGLSKKNEDKKNTAYTEYKEYSSLGNMQYKGTSLFGVTTGVLTMLGARFLFSDYLQRNIIAFGYDNVFSYYDFNKSVHLGDINYWNNTYRLIWNLGYELMYLPSFESVDLEFSVPGEFTHTGQINFRYRLFEKGHWFSSVSSSKFVNVSDNSYVYTTDFLEEDGLKKDSFISNEQSSSEIMGLWKGQINFGYIRSYPFSYGFNKAVLFKLFFDNRYYFHSRLNGFKAGLIGDSAFYIGRELYMFPSVSYTRSFHPEVNPVRAHLYTSSRFRNTNDLNSSSFFHLQEFQLEDIGSSRFISGDIYGFLFKSRYHAESITTLSLGFKKVFNPSWGSWSRFAPLARVRWLMLENLQDSKRIGIKDIINATKTQIRDISPEQIQKFVEDVQDKMKRETEEMTKYTHWLEWTVGFEAEFLVYNRARLILGLGLGVKTPLKFWASSADETSGNESKDIFGISIPGDSVAEVFFKMPL